MKLSDLWPRAGAGKPATPVVSVAVTKRAGAGQPVATGNTPASICAPRGPAELPATLAECEVPEETLARDAIRLECQIGVAEGTAKAEKRYADPTWCHRAKAALKHINRDRQRLMQHMKALRIEARRSCPAWQARDKAILRELNARVSKEVFDECVRVVDEELEVLR
ncbi:hypothetical protein N5D79_13310 [Pseudomonas sp. GD03817]|uniref:hypothetical protein n=1 Tax=Pseudomonas TaxID=286 RepID=UPI0008637176|nr:MULTISPECIES: hypothetical protein [Pseudomonas]EKT4484049.1 hypothetical protein [Pseudomonas putida]EKT4502731.1 hypothetical protein [Pseudomonas putida]MCE0961684.1 hypothetical protein [Pseudomonas putida]MDD2119694.1 hypothetical protein [Pseudomonas putida]MDH1403876.1 hypothetical protein [Pseudomonas sp. GD03730]